MLGVAACGGGGGGGGGTTQAPSPGATYFPIETGSFWNYSGSAGTTTVRLSGQRATATGAAWVFSVQTPQEQGESLYRVDGTSVRFVATASSDPTTRALGDFEVLRQPPAVGTQWRRYAVTFIRLVDIDGDGIRDDVSFVSEATVVEIGPLTTPAGSFDAVALVRTVDTQTATLSSSQQPLVLTITSDDWYAPDVGLVRNVTMAAGAGAAQREESVLVSYRVGNLRSDHVAPQVATRVPAPGSLAGSAVVRVVFNEAMDTSSTTGVALTAPGGQPVTGGARWLDNRTLVFEPTQPLATGHHQVSVAAPLADMFGNSMAAPDAWSFDIDATGPVVTAVSPADGTVDVPLQSTIAITFDEPIDPASVDSNQVTLRNDAELGPIAVDLAVSGRELRITPRAPLLRALRHEVAIAAGVRDALGNAGLTFTTSFHTDSGRFHLPAPFPGMRPSAVMAVDIDGDGRRDLIGRVISPVDGRLVTLHLWHQNIDGTLATPLQLPTTGGCLVEIFDAADVDGDGRLDVIAGGPFCPPEWLRQQADGSFVRQGAIGSDQRAHLVALPIAADGGRPAVLAFGDAVWYLHRQSAPGVFAAPQALPIPQSVTDWAVVDVDGDGLTDIVVTGTVVADQPGILILHQQPDGSFGQPLELPVASPFSPLSMTVADIDGDGKRDLLIVLAPEGKQLAVMRQTAPKQFAAPDLMPLAGAAQALVGDIDGDGRADLLVTQIDKANALSIYLRQPDGSYAAPEIYSMTEKPGSKSVLADVSGDGRLDVIAGASIWRQRPRAGANQAPSRVGTMGLPRAPSLLR